MENEIKELKKVMLEQLQMITLQMKMITEQNKIIKSLDWANPEYISVSFVSEKTGKSRQAIRQYVIRNFKLDQDYFYEGKIMKISKDCMKKITIRRVK